MDWNNVSWWEVLSALRAADWRQRPQPLTEFLQLNRFTLPKTRAKWSARAKNNIFYYHVNYVVVLGAVLFFLLFRRPKAAVAVAALAFAAATVNDTVQASLSSQLMAAAAYVARRTGGPIIWRLPRGLAGSTAASTTSLGQTLPGTGGSSRLRLNRIFQRSLTILFTTAAGFTVFRMGAAFRLAAGLLVGSVFIFLHATIRSPNLKARLGSARDEFRALWRGYQEIDAIDYTL